MARAGHQPNPPQRRARQTPRRLTCIAQQPELLGTLGWRKLYTQGLAELQLGQGLLAFCRERLCVGSRNARLSHSKPDQRRLRLALVVPNLPDPRSTQSHARSHLLHSTGNAPAAPKSGLFGRSSSVQLLSQHVSSAVRWKKRKHPGRYFSQYPEAHDLAPEQSTMTRRTERLR